jgi:hypothetical protein
MIATRDEGRLAVALSVQKPGVYRPIDEDCEYRRTPSPAQQF